MGTLNDFRDFLTGCKSVLLRADAALSARQSRYEEFYGEVCRVRELELEQLTAHIVADRSALPDDFDERLDRAWSEAIAEFDAKLAALVAKHEAQCAKTDESHAKSLAAEAKVRRENVALDQREEELKPRSQDLLRRIDVYNANIREAGRGFGFFKNFMSMRRLLRERRALEAEQKDLADHIEALRARWVNEEQAHAERERELRARWIKQRTEAAAVRTKIEYLETSRQQIVQRSALEAVLYAYRPRGAEPSEGDPLCPRCNQPNAPGTFFCRMCALRLVEDRSDFAGSLNEIAELNEHFEAFTKGMRACQEIIALVRGLVTGIDNFTKSVDDMIATQKKYPVGTLKIDVPRPSRAYSQAFDMLRESAESGRAMHPTLFAAAVQLDIAEVFTEAKIKAFFETMGAELSRQADAQW